MNRSSSFPYAIAAILCWSTVATAFKLALAGMSPLVFLTIVAATSAVVLFFALLIQKKIPSLLTVTLRQWGMLLLLTSLVPLAYYLMLFKAYSLLPAQLAQPLNMVWPLTLAFLSVPLLKQKISNRSFTVLFISLIGVFLIASRDNPALLFTSFDKNFWTGVSLAVGSSVIWALFWILNVRTKMESTLKLFLTFTIASFLLIPVCLITKEPLPKTIYLLPALYTGIFETGIAYLLWLKAMHLSSDNSRIGNLVFLTPFISLIFIYTILGESIYYTTFAGLLLIVGSILFQKIGKSGVTAA